MNVGNRVRLLSVVGAVAMIVLALIISNYISYTRNNVEIVVEDVVPSYQALLKVQQSFLNARRELFAHIIEHEPAKMAAIRQRFDALVADLNEGMKQYAESFVDDRDKEITTNAIKHIAKWQELVEPMFAASTAQNKDEAYRLVMENTAPEATEVFKGMEAMSAYYNERAKNAKNNTEDGFSELLRIVIGLTVVMVIVMFLIGEFVTRSITRPLGALRDMVGQVAKDYDFTRRATGISKDEVGQTQHSFNGLLESVQNSLRQLRDIGKSVGERAGDVATASTELSSASNMVSNSSEKMAAGTEEVTVSVTHVADRATEADECARRAGSQAENGGAVIEGTIARINQIAHHVRQSSSQIESLVQRTESIGAVVNTIKEIADQTNLLALNAAIEAARAGEAGRGFAVVADEVRKLAERTSGSTQEISSTVHAIQTEAAQTVSVMKNTVTEVEAGVANAQGALEAITQIRQTTDEVMSQVADISSAMREQSAASNSMAHEIEKVAQMAEETSVTAQRTAESSTELNGLATDLNKVIGTYTI